MHTYKEISEFCASIYGNRPLLIVPYAYNLVFTAFTPLQSQTKQLDITANADFVFTELVYTGWDDLGGIAGTANQPDPYAQILITDSGSGEQFMNSLTDLQLYGTTGYNFRPLSFPRFVQGRTSLSIQLTSLDTATTVPRVDVSLKGVLVRAFTN